LARWAREKERTVLRIEGGGSALGDEADGKEGRGRVSVGQVVEFVPVLGFLTNLTGASGGVATAFFGNNRRGNILVLLLFSNGRATPEKRGEVYYTVLIFLQISFQYENPFTIPRGRKFLWQQSRYCVR